MSGQPRFLVNGQATQQLALTDRSIHYGDGIFTTLRVHAGQPLWWPKHWQRLLRDAASLNMPPLPDTAQQQVLKAAQSLQHGVLKVIWSRGSGGRGYQLPAPAKAELILALYPLPEYPQSHWLEGVDVLLCQYLLGSQPHLAGAKHLNRLDQIMARTEWQQEYTEGLVRNQAGYWVEGVQSNLLLVKGKTLLLPILADCGVNGVALQYWCKFARLQGWAVQQQHIDDAVLAGADEILLSNSVIGLWPVKTLQQRTPPTTSADIIWQAKCNQPLGQLMLAHWQGLLAHP